MSAPAVDTPLAPAADTTKSGAGREPSRRRGRGSRNVTEARLSSAARRAYERRQERARSLGGEWAALARRGRAGLAARIPFVVTVIGLVACGLALTLLLTTRAAADSYRLGKAREVNRALTEARTALQREVQAADSAPELAARARGLGMIPAKDPARLVVGPDGKVTVVGKPVPAQGEPVPLLNPPAPGGHRMQHHPLPGGPATPGANSPQIQAQGEHLTPVTIPGAAAAPQQQPAGAVPAQAVPAPAVQPPVPPVAPPVVAAPPAPPTVLGGGAR